jgi:hypothetical protein
MNLNLSSLIALALLAVAVTLTVVSAESCYECNSITNSYCENLENTAKVEIKKCDEGVKFCRKIVQTGTFVSSISFIFRLRLGFMGWEQYCVTNFFVIVAFWQILE